MTPVKIIKYFLIVLAILIASSVDAQNIGRVERKILGHSDNPGKSNQVQFSVFDKFENPLYSFFVDVDYDLPYPDAYLFSNGSCAVIWSYDASVDFYSNDGAMNSKIFLLDEKDIEYERAIYASSDDKQIAVAVTEANMNKSFVKVLNSSAQLLAGWEVESKHITGLELSSQYNLIAVSGYNYLMQGPENKTIFYSAKGKILSSFNSSFRKGRFNSNKLFTGYDNTNAFTIDLNSQSIINFYNANRNELILDAVVFKEELKVLVTQSPELLNGRWVYNDAAVVSLIGGKIITRHQIQNDSFNQASIKLISGKINLDIDGKIVRLD